MPLNAKRLPVICRLSTSTAEIEMNYGSLTGFFCGFPLLIAELSWRPPQIRCRHNNRGTPPPCPLLRRRRRGTFPSSDSPLRTWWRTRTTRRPRGRRRRTWSGRSRTWGSRCRPRRRRRRRRFGRCDSSSPGSRGAPRRPRWSGRCPSGGSACPGGRTGRRPSAAARAPRSRPSWSCEAVAVAGPVVCGGGEPPIGVAVNGKRVAQKHCLSVAQPTQLVAELVRPALARSCLSVSPK